MADSIWKILYEKLQAAGFSVYSPGQHVGMCTDKYVVIKDAGTTRFAGYSTNICFYDVMCYVPMGEFSQLEPYVEAVKTCLKEMYPVLKPTGYQTPSFLDDSNQSYMVSVQYTNNKKMFYN